MRFGSYLLASLSCLPLAACLEEGDADAENPDEEETLSTTESTLCSDGPADAIVTFYDSGGELTATSALPTNNYDHPACSDRFTVEVTGVSQASTPFSVIGGWGENLPATESSCALARANVQTHEYKVTGFNCTGQLCIPVYGWVQVGAEIPLHGEWQPWLFGSYHCVLEPSSPLPVFQPKGFRSKVRVAVRAYAWALFFPAYKRGEAGVYSQPIIN